jgi:hypothetical protein
MYKIANGLGMGPALTRHCGFDIIIYRDCLEFSMERCKDLEEVP